MAKKIAVFGLGKSGLSAMRLLSHLKDQVFLVNRGQFNTWADREEIEKYVDQSHCLSQEDPNTANILSTMDEIILSPGIAREHEILRAALNLGVNVINEIELALRFLSAPVIAVTGTNGKTTTVSLIQEMLEKSEIDSFLGGNIGVPLSDHALAVLRGESQAQVLVLELSSFQLESLPSLAPKAACILNIYPNHGERYASTDDYTLAKLNIYKKMDSMSTLYLPKDDEYLSRLVNNIPCQSITLSTSESHVLESLKDYDLSGFKLLGEHNLSNLMFAELLAKEAGATKEGIQAAMNSFCGVEYRLEYLETNLDCTIYNDAKSTNWDATLVALKSFEKRSEPLHLILGGALRGRGDEIAPYFEEIEKACDKVYLIGQAGKKLNQEISLRGKQTLEIEVCENLKEVYDSVVESGHKGDLLFSPAFPSFDQYANYIERGKDFRAIFSGE